MRAEDARDMRARIGQPEVGKIASHIERATVDCKKVDEAVRMQHLRHRTPRMAPIAALAVECRHDPRATVGTLGASGSQRSYYALGRQAGKVVWLFFEVTRTISPLFSNAPGHNSMRVLSTRLRAKARARHVSLPLGGILKKSAHMTTNASHSVM
jgi:hypothetical protein